MKSLNLEPQLLRHLDQHPESTSSEILSYFPGLNANTLKCNLAKLIRDNKIELVAGKRYRVLPVQMDLAISTLGGSSTLTRDPTSTLTAKHPPEVSQNSAICTSVLQEEKKSSDGPSGLVEWKEFSTTRAVQRLIDLAGPDLLEGSGRRRKSMLGMLRVLVSAHPKIVMQSLVRMGMEYDALAHQQHNRAHNPNLGYEERPPDLPLQDYGWATVDAQRWFKFDSRTKKCVGLNHELLARLHDTWSDLATRIGHDFIDDLRQAVHSVKGIPAPQSELEELLTKYKPPMEILAFNLKAVHLRRTAVRKEKLAADDLKAWEALIPTPESDEDNS